MESPGEVKYFQRIENKMSTNASITNCDLCAMNERSRLVESESDRMNQTRPNQSNKV